MIFLTSVPFSINLYLVSLSPTWSTPEVWKPREKQACEALSLASPQWGYWPRKSCSRHIPRHILAGHWEINEREGTELQKVMVQATICGSKLKSVNSPTSPSCCAGEQSRGFNHEVCKALALPFSSLLVQRPSSPCSSLNAHLPQI